MTTIRGQSEDEIQGEVVTRGGAEEQSRGRGADPVAYLRSLGGNLACELHMVATEIDRRLVHQRQGVEEVARELLLLVESAEREPEGEGALYLDEVRSLANSLTESVQLSEGSAGEAIVSRERYAGVVGALRYIGEHGDSSGSVALTALAVHVERRELEEWEEQHARSLANNLGDGGTDDQ